MRMPHPSERTPPLSVNFEKPTTIQSKKNAPTSRRKKTHINCLQTATYSLNLSLERDDP